MSKRFPFVVTFEDLYSELKADPSGAGELLFRAIHRHRTHTDEHGPFLRTVIGRENRAWFYSDGTYRFRKEEDAALFKLRFG